MGSKVVSETEQGLLENERIPGISALWQPVKEKHLKIILFDNQAAEKKIQEYETANPSSVNAGEFIKLEKELIGLAADANALLKAGVSAVVGKRKARDIIRLQEELKSVKSSMYKRSSADFRRLGQQLRASRNQRNKITEIRQSQYNLLGLYEHLKNRSRCKPLELFREAREKFSSLDEKIAAAEQLFVGSESFDAVKKKLRNSWGNGLINECEKQEYYEGAIRARQMYEDVSKFENGMRPLELKIQKEKSELSKKIDELQAANSLREIAEVHVKNKSYPNTNIRIRKRCDEYNEIVSAVLEQVDAKASGILKQESEKLNSLFEEACSYRNCEELESAIEKLNSIDSRINEINSDIRAVDRIEQMPCYHVYCVNGLGSLQKKAVEQKQKAQQVLEKSRQDLAAVQSRAEEVRNISKGLDDALEKGQLRSLVNAVVSANNLEFQPVENELISDSINELRKEYELFQNRREKANMRVQTQLDKAIADLSDNMHETGIDFCADKSMLEQSELQFRILKECSEKYSSYYENPALDIIGQKIKELSQKYKIVKAEVKIIEDATNRINRLVETGSVNELKKVNLDSGRFEANEKYHEPYVLEYQQAVANAKYFIEHGPDSHSDFFSFEEHMLKFRPVNKDYLKLPKIVLGIYKNVPLEDRPEVLESKIRQLAFAKHERDFEYMEGFRNALEAWKEKGMGSILRNSSSKRYAIDQMVAVVEDYIQKSRENL
jgi:hypothetical protein